MSGFQENQVFMLPFLGQEYPVSVRVSSYLHNRNLFVGLTTDEDGYTEPFADMTVNISGLPPYYAALDTNNLPGATTFVERESLGKPTG